MLARANRALVPPGLTMTRVPGLSIAAMVSYFPTSAQRAIGVLPSCRMGAENIPLLARSLRRDRDPSHRDVETIGLKISRQLRPRGARLRFALRPRPSSIRGHRSRHSRTQGAHRDRKELREELEADPDRRHRRKRGRLHFSERHDASIYRSIAATDIQRAAVLFSRDDGLRHLASLRRRTHQE